MNQEQELILDSRPEELDRARDWAARQAREMGFSQEAIDDLHLALTEAVTNVIRHAYDREPGHPVFLSALRRGDDLVVTIRDLGRKMDTTKYHAPDLSTPHEGGYGIYLMRSVMDEIHFDTSQDKGTILTLVKRLKRAAAPTRVTEP